MDTSQSKLPSLAYLCNIVVVSVVIWRYYAGIKVLNKKKNVGVMFKTTASVEEKIQWQEKSGSVKHPIDLQQ